MPRGQIKAVELRVPAAGGLGKKARLFPGEKGSRKLQLTDSKCRPSSRRRERGGGCRLRESRRLCPGPVPGLLSSSLTSLKVLSVHPSLYPPRQSFNLCARAIYVEMLGSKSFYFLSLSFLLFRAWFLVHLFIVFFVVSFCVLQYIRVSYS